MLLTRKEQMQKVKHLERKVDAISANVEDKMLDFLAENLAEIVQFNDVMILTLREVLNDKQHDAFMEVLAVKMLEAKAD